MRVLLRLVALVHPQPCCFSASSFSTCGNAQDGKINDALNYCVKIVRERDFENYFAVLLMAKPARARIFMILALNAEIATLRHKIKRGAGVAGINQLTFWKDALETFGRHNHKKGLLPRQPVITALNAFGSRADVPLLLRLVNARQQTLGDRPFANVHALESHSRELYGTLISLQMRALHEAISKVRGESDDKQKEKYQLEMTEEAQCAVDAMACAIGILTLIRATVLLLRDGVVLLPQDLTSIHGVTASMALREPNSLKAVVRDLCEISDRHLSIARSAPSLSAICPSLRPALLTCGLRADHVLSVLRSNNFNLLDVRLHQRHPMSALKLWWRNKRKKY